MKIDALWLTEKPLAQLLSVLNRDGEAARAVGGAVRNTLPPAAWRHRCCDHRVPQEVTRRAKPPASGGADRFEHGTVTVVIEAARSRYDLREDVETSGAMRP